MNIKNIQEYRDFYKTEIRGLEKTRDENFIGNFLIDEKTGKKKFGWFDIYHGDKEGYGKAEAGIENFLQSFLDMAKDGQAVYEFLQNAVDAGSTHYTMVWGQDEIDDNYYLLVANNGKMFNLDSIRSILNVGSSTKTADSQTIGKFGIGFKLAHRLVGKDNGLQELIHENSGPILFSWKNYELENLANSDALIPTKIDYKSLGNGNFEIEDENPWLFKILITCFPCLPENDEVIELPKMANGIDAKINPFGMMEYNVLTRWVKNNKSILNKETYNEGALFFIKLGSGKETELGEINLKEGVKFALAILKETADSEAQKDKILRTVQLNNEEPITYPDLEYIKFSVDKVTEKDTYAFIRFGVKTYDELTFEQKKKLTEEANIEALFGFRKHNEIGDYFKGAPNLYLYFPLSEEVHNFNYILHSNAFYKGSSRTFLHKGSSKEDGINERLLRTIVDKIDAELSRLSSSTNEQERQLFLHFYAALLTSGISLNQDRKWIEEPYINRINALLKKYIPIRHSTNSADFTITDKPDNVFIKKTQIEIDTQTWDLADVNWFYWSDEAANCIKEKALSKLGIKDFTIQNLLSTHEKISTFLNGWINDDNAKINKVVSEIAPLKAEEVMKNNTFKNNFLNTKLLKFNNDELLSINEFQENERIGYFIIFNKLNDIQDLLQKLGLNHTKESFDDYGKYFPYFANHSQVRSHLALTKLFSQVVTDENLGSLDKDEKYRIFEAFRTLNDTPGERMGELKLFKNNNNQHVCFKNLYSISDKPWLNKFCIHHLEDHSDYKRYLLDDSKKLYQGIVYPFWEQIASYTTSVNGDEAKETLDDLVTAFEDSSWDEKTKNYLSKSNQIIFQSEVNESHKVFFNTGLINLSDEIFKNIQATTLKYFGVYIPDQYLLPYFDKPPFSFASTTIKPQIADTISSLEDISDLLLLSKICNIDFFASNCIVFTEGGYFIDSTSDKTQIAVSKPVVQKYIDKFYPNEYILIPECFNDYKSKIELSDNQLIEHLIDIFVENGLITQELDLIEVVLNERYEDKKALLQKLTFINFLASWTDVRQNELYLKLLKSFVEENINAKELANIHKKIVIHKGEQKIIIGDIESANDSVEVLRGEKKISLSQSQILNLTDADDFKLIQEFNDEVQNRELLGHTIADKLFKISNSGVTNDLVTKFKANLKGMQLVNSHQVLFVLLSGRINKEDFKKYKIQFQDGLWYPLKRPLIIYSEENIKFIAHHFLLNEHYSDLQSLLRLTDLEVFNYTDNEDDIIISNFLFVKGCATDILESNANVISKLNYLYNNWINLPSSLKDPKKDHDSQVSWKKYLNICPNQYVLNGIQTAKEILPIEFLDWYQNDRKKGDFLYAIGVNIGDSRIEKLRKFLTRKNNDFPLDIEIEKFNPQLLQNTINGLAGEFTYLHNEAIIYENHHIQELSLIEKIINHLSGLKTPEYPVLIYHTICSFKVLKPSEKSICKFDETLHTKLKASNDNQLHLLYGEYNILRQSNFLETRIIEASPDLAIVKTFVPSDSHSEHDEPFYRNWREEFDIQLFRESEICYDISIDIDNKTTIIGRTNEGNFHFDDSDNLWKIYYNRNVSLEELRNTMPQKAIRYIQDIINKRDLMLTNLYNALNSVGKNELGNAHLEALNAVFKEESLKQERKELIESIQSNSQYSYVWFESYLKFLLTFENKQDVQNSKSISFQKIERFSINEELSNRYFLLRGGSSMIPLNIEDFEDFKITLVIKNRQNENITVEGVSKKGQDLLIYCREPIPQSIINTFSNVLQVKISFTPVIDLLQKLYNAFVNRNNMDVWDDIQDTLPNLQFIYGPPGTGKTTTLCSMIIDGIKEKYDAKYLLLTPTNKAADVLCKKLSTSNASSDRISEQLIELEKLGHSISVTRIGKPTDPELEEMAEDVYQDSLRMERLDYTNVVATTIHRIPYFEVADDDTYIKLFKLPDYWDYVIFDEASMINLPYLVFAILAIHKFNPNAQFIIAGDPKQIPPVVDVSDKDLEELDIKEENVYTMMGIHSFDSSQQDLRECDEIDNLETQYRSVTKIGQLFSDLSYSNLLKHHRNGKNVSKPLPEAFKKLIKDNVTFIDIPIDKENSIFKINKLFYSPYHIYSAIFVSELIKHFDSLLEENDNWTIGLIAPYKAQAILLNKLITSYGISDKLKIYSDTVHGFQGDECDIVFFISNPNNYYFTGHDRCLLSKEYIYNVAISRARDYLIVLHPFEAIKNNPFINKITDSYSKHFKQPNIRKSSEFEKVIFNKKDFIEKNSYITGHDNVNVFGQIDMKYFIKANDNAIDIQLSREI